ncbi:hypothetical protein DFH08DRAFT_976044 [Mycena albidolilacea]|uniref:Uncharacterized protein n=1 Tax=Mycena albidolilacea TaxID=1033008 RepID=A0AAD6Z3E5_9AGAR|nr:hypothetical protein DFH08DRAFT_976044 [Mycena albidolilacea]
MSEPHPIWGPFNHRFAEGLNEYLLGNEPLIDKIQVAEDFYAALPVLEYYTDNFGNTTRPRSFKLFISGINRILLFLDNVPGVWANYFVTEEARGVQREGFEIPFVEPPLLSPLEFGFGGSPIYSMSATCPAGFYPPDCDTVEAAFKYKPQRKIGGGKSSSSSTSTAKPLTRAPAAVPSSLAGASLSGPVHNSAAHRIPYVLVPDRKTVYAEDKNSTAPKRKKTDTSQGEDSDTPVVVDRPTNVNDPQPVNARVPKKAKLEIKEPTLKTPVAKPQGSSTAISAAPHRKPATGAKPTVARELSAADFDTVTGKFKSIFTRMVTNKEFGTNPTDKSKLFRPITSDFPMFVAVVKKKSGARYDFTSHLPLVSSNRTTSNEASPTFNPLPLIEHETVTDLNLEDGVLPTTGCQKCKLERKLCVPSGLGSSCFNCIQAGFRFCDHHQTLDQLVQTQLELAETYAMASDVTHAHVANLNSAFTLLKRSAQAHYEDAQKFSTALSGFQLHTLKRARGDPRRLDGGLIKLDALDHA